MGIILNLHGLIPMSRVNGPGTRSVVFFQGCGRGCAGCFNTSTHDFSPNKTMTAEQVLCQVPDGVEGLTISGGEPFEQPSGLLALLKAARFSPRRTLSVLVYTGFTLKEIKTDEARMEALPFIDLLIAGPYDESRPEKTALARGSTNQTFHFLSPRYTLNDLYLPARSEISIGADGSLTGTGFSRLSSIVESI